MIVIDTSVWIDILNGSDTPQALHGEQLIAEGYSVALTDVILTEILQGLNNDLEAKKVEKQLLAFPVLRLEGITDFITAAQIYRTARKSGITIRKTLDCLIAVPCIRTKTPLLHRDSDFDRLAECTSLRIWKEWE